MRPGAFSVRTCAVFCTLKLGIQVTVRVRAGCVLGASWCVLGAHLCCILYPKAFRTLFACVLGAFWVRLGCAWVRPGAFWVRTCALFCTLKLGMQVIVRVRSGCVLCAPCVRPVAFSVRPVRTCALFCTLKLGIQGTVRVRPGASAGAFAGAFAGASWALSLAPVLYSVP